MSRYDLSKHNLIIKSEKEMIEFNSQMSPREAAITRAILRYVLLREQERKGTIILPCFDGREEWKHCDKFERQMTYLALEQVTLLENHIDYERERGYEDLFLSPVRRDEIRQLMQQPFRITMGLSDNLEPIGEGVLCGTEC
ncbi:hypothetical protein [Photobacterium leiognathi]|uniref:hypothetical protein n=1 Tax=Photobacterium leiognathi TaxID=553611 RepID=UPI002980C18C|nr:hypothetical protein [Photobacterium leiognathi]